MTTTDELAAVSDAIAKIEPDQQDLHDHIAITLMKLDELMRRGRELQRELKDRMKPWIESNGPVVIGDVRYVLVNKKTEKVRSLRSAIENLYTATGGDFDAFVDCLSMNAIKPGAAKKVLGSEFENVFEVIVETDVEGKPVKQVAALNDRFLK